MGRLVQLELNNFKSYAGQQTIGPFDNFTCIIGPNGAGKSNMMDAISFVLGVQSTHLRSSHLRELIFRKDASSPPARKATVKLIYELSSDEIAGKKDGDRMHFSRTISSTGVSTYKLDDKETTFAAYEATLQKIGVLVKARNFLVFQGDVESVASKSPMELTKLVEQICGSDAYRGQYEDLMRQKDEAEENTVFSLQKKKMFSTQQKEVREQKEEAEVFEKRRQLREDLKTEHILWKIFRIKTSMEGHQERADGLLEEVEAARQKEQTLDDELQQAKQRLARVIKSLTTVEKDLLVKQKQLKNLAPQLHETRDKKKRVERRLEDLERGAKRLADDQRDGVTNTSELRADIERLEGIKRSLERQLSTASDQALNLSSEQLEVYGRLKEEAAAQTAKSKAELRTITLELTSKNAHARNLKGQEEGIAREVERTNRMVAEYGERASKLGRVADETAAARDKTRTERDERAAEMRECVAKGERLEAEHEKVSSKLREAGNDRQRSKKEQRMTEAVDNMKRIFTGVHGKLQDLCRPIQKKYSTALSQASGKVMDAIVVDNKAVAQDCIRYLKDQRVGICTFLPLDNLVSKPVPERLRQLGGSFRACVDLVECETRFKPAVAYAVGNTVICDTLDDARDLAFTQGERLKLVTLTGEMIAKSGAMTGGQMAGSERGDRWEEKELEKLRSDKSKIEEAIAQNKRATPSRQLLLEMETSVKTLQTRMQYALADKNVAEEKVSQLQERLAAVQGTAAELSSERATLEAEIAALEKAREAKTETIREHEASIFAAFSAQLGVADVQEFETTRMRTHTDLMRKLVATSEQHASLSSQLQYESKRDFESALTRARQQMEDAREALKMLAEEEKELLQEDAALRASVREATTKVDAQKKEQLKRAAAAKAVFVQRREANVSRENVAKKVSGEEIRVERLRSQLHEVLQRAQVDEVALPAVELTEEEEEESQQSESSSSGPSGSSQQRGRSASRNGTSALIWTGTRSTHSASTHYSQGDDPKVVRDKRRAARVDLSSLERFKTLSADEQQAKEEALGKRLQEISLELEAMQPNMHAAERYAGVLGKLRDCSDDLEENKDAARRSAEQFESVRKARQDRFKECFAFVSKALGVIYKDLTRSSKHPLGGNAYLTLDNTDEPYLGGIRYTAMPPMKRFRDMDQLSGGEKTIAALALLFSIHSYRQAPFFVLDEVDAALDNVNVKKICNYMRQRSRDFQCIVISLKDMFFEHADSLVGVAKDVDTLSSKVLTLDLKGYPARSDPDAAKGALAAVAGVKGDGSEETVEGSRLLDQTGTSSPGGTAGQHQSPGTHGLGGKKAAKRRAVSYLPDVPEET